MCRPSLISPSEKLSGGCEIQSRNPLTPPLDSLPSPAFLGIIEVFSWGAKPSCRALASRTWFHIVTIKRRASTQNAMLSSIPVLSVTPVLGAKVICMPLLPPALMGVSGKLVQLNEHWLTSVGEGIGFPVASVQVCVLARKKATERESKPK
jgi:hypothetical protein